MITNKNQKTDKTLASQVYEYSFEFVIYLASDVLVFLIDEKNRLINIDPDFYSVRINDNLSEGVVTFSNIEFISENIGKTIRIKRVVKYTQSLSLSTATGLPKKALEIALDSIVIQIQQISSIIDNILEINSIGIEWNSIENYQEGSLVLFNSNYYLSLQDDNEGNSPSSTSQWWVEVTLSGLSHWEVGVLYHDGQFVLRDKKLFISTSDDNIGNDPDTDEDNWESYFISTVYSDSITYSKYQVVSFSDDNQYISLVDGNKGNSPDASPDQWKVYFSYDIYSDQVSYEADQIVGFEKNLYISIQDNNLGNDLSETDWWQLAVIPSKTIKDWIDAKIIDEDVQGKINASIGSIDHLVALDVPALLNEIRPTVETWSSGGGSKVNVLRDNQDITLPNSPEIGDNFNVLVQATTPGKIKQIAGTTLRDQQNYNATGVDGFLRLRNNQRLEVAYVADELIEDRGYTYLPNLLDTRADAGVTSLAISPDGRYIGLGLNSSPYFAIYRIDGTQFRKVAVSTASLFSAPPLAFAFNPENNDIHMGLPGVNSHMILGFDGTDLTFKEVIRQNNRAVTYSISFSPDGRYKAEGHSGGTVTITDLRTNTEVDHPVGVGSLDVIHSLAFSPNPPAGMDQVLAIGHFGDPCITFLSFSDGVITKLPRPRAIRHRAEAIKSMAWSNDGELLAVNLSGEEIAVYDMTGYEATVLTELTLANNDRISGTLFFSVAFSKLKHLGVSFGYDRSPYSNFVNIYNFENNSVPTGYFKRIAPGPSIGDTAPILWTIAAGYFLYGDESNRFMVYHALTFTEGAWFVSRLDGPEIQPSDFSGIGSPALVPDEEVKPANKKKPKKKENK